MARSGLFEVFALLAATARRVVVITYPKADSTIVLPPQK